MADYGHRMTDAELARLEKKIQRVYAQAAAELNETVTAYFGSFEKRDAEQRKLVDAGKLTEDEYKRWRLAQIGRGERYEAMRDKVANRYTKANEVAISYVNDKTPSIYTLNRNYASYTIEQVHPGVDFTLYDEATVRRMVMVEPDLMPNYPATKALKRGLDLKYGKKQINAVVTSSILQGKGIGGIADALQNRMETMNRASAIRTARTAFTSAENGGRIDTYKAATLMGIQMQQEWMATLDGRTRHSHQLLDGERIEVGGTFSNGCRYPGDPQGAPAEIYNCRCTLVAVVDGLDAKDTDRMTYREWAGRNSDEENSFTQWLEYKKNLRNGTAGLSKETKEAMNTILENSSHESVKALFKKYKNKIRCVDNNATFNRYSRVDGGVHLRESALKAGNIHKNPYQSAFHEYAHNIDWLMGPRKSYKSNVAINGERLYDVINRDYNQLKADWNALDDAELVQAIKIIGQARGYTERDLGQVSDVIQGCTGIVRPLNVGHQEGYFDSDEKREREFFAEVIESAAANETSYQLLVEMFPNSVAMVEKMIGG